MFGYLNVWIVCWFPILKFIYTKIQEMYSLLTCNNQLLDQSFKKFNDVRVVTEEDSFLLQVLLEINFMFHSLHGLEPRFNFHTRSAYWWLNVFQLSLTISLLLFGCIASSSPLQIYPTQHCCVLCSSIIVLIHVSNLIVCI